MRAKKWPRPEQTGKVYLCYHETCEPPADTDDFDVLSCSGTLEEAREDARTMFGCAAIWACDYHVDPVLGDWADNEQFVEVIHATPAVGR